MSRDRLYLADGVIADMEVSVTFSAPSIERAEEICTQNNWLLVGRFIEEVSSDAHQVDRRLH